VNESTWKCWGDCVSVRVQKGCLGTLKNCLQGLQWGDTVTLCLQPLKKKGETAVCQHVGPSAQRAAAQAPEKVPGRALM
jgi:hypothetical protein